MANLFDYLEWRGDLTFEQVPFNKIDALLLSHISYSLLDGLVSTDIGEQKTIKQLAKDFKATPDYDRRIEIGYVINKKITDLMFKAAKSARFKNVKISGYREIFDEKKAEQFAAMTYEADKKIIISYRGTDDTLVGWKEDFNIVWQDPIPSQADALIYIDEAAKEFLFKPIVIIGHSKGGNLAINTAVKCGAKLQKRIEKIYNFDGPGFPAEYFKKPEYLEIEPKFVNIYPQASIVGMIFEHPEKFEIVKSDAAGVLQHDPLSWQILGGNFETKKDFDEESKFFYKTLNGWVARLTPDQTKRFVTALWDVIMASDVKTLTELQENAFHSATKIIAKFASLDKATKKEVREVLNLFINTVMKETPLGKNLLWKNSL